jgi:hypothetical protein
MKMPQVALNRRGCLRVTASCRGLLGTADEVPRLVEFAVEYGHYAAIQQHGSGKPTVWRKFEDVLGDITVAA